MPPREVAVHPIPHDRLRSAFTPGARLDAWIEWTGPDGQPRRAGGIWYLRPVRLGRLEVHSGRLVAGDPCMAFDMTGPFARRIPNGEYEAWVSIADPPPMRRRKPTPCGPAAMAAEPRVAYLALFLSHEVPATYEFAALEKPPGERPIDEFEGFGVDSATAALVDAADVPQIENFADTPAADLWEQCCAGIDAHAA